MRLYFDRRTKFRAYFYRCRFMRKESKKLHITACSKKKISTELIANRVIPLPFYNPLITVKISGTEKDSSDNLIFNNARKGDVAVTRDYKLAERLLDNGIHVLNDKGIIFTKENIKTYLEERELGLKLKSLGSVPKGKWDTYSRDDLLKFKKSLTVVLTN